MDWNQLIVLLSLILLAYTWIGYPVLILTVRRVLARPVARSSIHPQVSIILAVHNEQACVEDKPRDCLNLKYPADRIEILVSSDHSTDETEPLVEQFAMRDPRIRLLRTGARAGKSGAQNLAAGQAKGEILFFTDANTRMDRKLWTACRKFLRPTSRFGNRHRQLPPAGRRSPAGARIVLAL